MTVPTGHFWGTQQIPPGGPFFLEIFAGLAGLSEAVLAGGIRILPPVELEVNSFVKFATDILDPEVLAHIHLLIQSGKILMIHFGTPCSSFSLARKDDGGPPPLRDPSHIWGKPGLSPLDQDKVDLGNRLAQITAVLVQLCSRHGVHWSIENPAGSYLWALPPIEELVIKCQGQRFELDMCRFGSPHMKPTALLSSVDLSAIALKCDKAVRPHKHEPLVGKVMVEGQVYPLQLCQQWAGLLRAAPHDPLSRTFQWKSDPSDRKRPVGQLAEWKVHKQRITAEKAKSAGYQLKRSALPPLLDREMEPGEAVERSLELIHPFTVPPALDPDLQEALAMVAFQPTQLLEHRSACLQWWSQRAHDLLSVTDKELTMIQDPALRSLLRGAEDHQPVKLGSVTHIALWREFFMAARGIDHHLLEEMVHGFPIVDQVTRSYRWPLLQDQQQGLPLEDLCSRAWEFTDKVLRNVMRSEVTENTQKIWEATMEDVQEGVTMGPFFSKEEVDKVVGTSCWVPTQRFEVVQKNKVRGVDSATVNGINMATSVVEKIDLPSTDVNVAALRWLRSNTPEGNKLWGWVLDERKACRQIPIRPDQRRWSVIALRQPTTGKISFFVMVGHSFGLVSAVYNYNRRSAAITDILRRVFSVAAFNFYDDKYGFESEATCGSAFECSKAVHFWLGARFDPKKLQLCKDPTILGVTYDLESMVLKIKESRKEELLDEIDSITTSGVLSPGQAGKLRGKLMFGASQLWGKIGRAFLRSLSERQYSKVPRSDVNKAISLSLDQWRLLVESGPPRPIECTGSRKTDFVIFTDGSFPDAKSSLADPWIGGVLFQRGARPIQFGCRVDKKLIDSWIPRKSQIAMVELFATVVALSTFGNRIKGSWSLLFVDSESALGALVKGYSAKEDLCELVGVFWNLALEFQINLFIDRVPTDSNPADPPSRASLEVGRALGWDEVDPIFPDSLQRGSSIQ